MTDKIVFLVKAGRINKISYGHLFRCVQINEKLKEIKKFKQIFLINKDSKSHKILRSKKISFIELNSFKKNQILSKLNEIRAQKIVIDTYDFVDDQFIKSLKKLNLKVILIDDIPKKNISADIIYNYSIISSLKRKYFDYKKLFFGPNYFLTFKKKKNRPEKNNFLIFLGGTDINNFTEKVLKNLIKLNLNFRIKFIIGPGYKNSNYLKLKKLNKSKFKIIKNVKNLENEIISHKYIISSAGYTMYKSLSFNKVCIIIPTSSHEKIISKHIKKMNLGLVTSTKFSDFKKTIEDAINRKLLIKNIKKNMLKYFGKNNFKRFLKNV